MKIFIVIISGLVFMYVLLFFAIKLTKPGFVCSDDSYIGWYGNISYPIRWIMATIKPNIYWKNGKYIFVDADPYNEKIKIKGSDGNIITTYIYDQDMQNNFNNVTRGDVLEIEFDKVLYEDTEEFEDCFTFYIKKFAIVNGG